MARIPDEVLERIKQDVSVLRLAEAMGGKFKKSGADNFIGCCLFHDDTTPSLVISVKKNVFHCLACGAKGSPIDWVMRAQGVSFRHAAELLREQSPSLDAPIASPVKVSTVRHLELPFEAGADDAQLLRQVVDYYHETLKQTPDALDYLKKRGLESSEMVDHFKLGYADRTLGYRIPERNRQLGAELRERLQTLGVIRDTGHEHFNGSIVIPVFDQVGNVTEIYGRKVTPNLRKGTPLHLYLPGPHRGVWNEDAFASKEVILCESLIDALTFWCAGYKNVTSSYGVNGFTDEHLEAMKRHGVERVLIAYDRDEAGDKAAAALAERLVAEGLTCFRVQFPHGLDANEYALKVQPAAQSLGLVIRSAVWLGGTSRERVPAASSLVARSSLAAAPRPAPVADPPGPPSSSLAEHIEPVPRSSNAAPKEAAKEEVLTAAKQDAAPEHTPSLAARLSVASEAPAPALELVGDAFAMQLGDRCYRVRGLPELLTYDQLKVNLHVTRTQPLPDGSGPRAGFHVETLNLYARPQRAAYAKEAGYELRVSEDAIKRDLGQVLQALEQVLEERRTKPAGESIAPVDAMSADERNEALALLKEPQLLDRVLEDFARCGVVGEQTNKLLGYLAATSRKLEEPLAIVIQSSSAAGKSSLMDAILAFMPDEERIKYSAMTGQSLFYMAGDLQHKILAIVEEEGASRASYALKLLQSEGELTIASTGKDPVSGRLVTQEYEVKGPVMLLLTTTALEVDEELLNRCLVLSVDEEREQTQAIHRLQRGRQTLEGLLNRRHAERIRRRHQNAQRLLRPLLVANPFAHELTFLDDRTRTRRDHLKYLTLIRTIALLHQYQRPLKKATYEGETVEYIEATLDDVAVANKIAHEALGRSLDELAPQTRRLLLSLERIVSEACEREGLDRIEYRFTRRQVREAIGCSQEQARVHLDRLVDLEYLLVHRGGRGQSFVYELLYAGEGQDGNRFLLRLLDVEALKNTTTMSNLPGSDTNLPGAKAVSPGPNRPLTGVKPALYRTPRSETKPNGSNGFLKEQPNSVGKSTYQEAQKTSVVEVARVVAAGP